MVPWEHIILIFMCIFIIIFFIWSLYVKIMRNYCIHKSIENKNFNKKFENQSNIPTIKKNLSDIPIYVINLSKSKDRLDRIKDQAKNLGIDLNIIEAVNGLELNNINKGHILYNNNILNYTNNDDSITRQDLGCTLSHLKVIYQNFKKNNDYFIVLEDDVTLSLISHWNKTLRDIISEAPINWDIISLYENCDTKRSEEFIDYIQNNCYGACAFLYNKRGYTKILNKIYSENDNTFNLDKNLSNNGRTISDFYIPSLVNSYTYKNSLFIPLNDIDNLNSTIHPSHTKGHLEMTNKVFNFYNRNLKIN